MATDDGFLSRWSRRKVQAVRGEPLPAEPPVAPAPVAAVPAPAAVVAEAKAPAAPPAEPPDPPPTMDDVRRLTPQADFTRFVKADVDPGVKQAALKTLFSDPHFNVMDGLDTYIDDYGKPDPLPASMLRKMVQSQFLGLFTETPATPAVPPEPLAEADAEAVTVAAAAPAEALPDEDPDLRLQPDDAAGRAEPGPGAGEDAGREP